MQARKSPIYRYRMMGLICLLAPGLGTYISELANAARRRHINLPAIILCLKKIFSAPSSTSIKLLCRTLVLSGPDQGLGVLAVCLVFEFSVGDFSYAHEWSFAVVFV